jgi:hypothetical protein
MTPFCRQSFAIAAASLLLVRSSAAQGFGLPLTMQGVDRITNHSASSQAVGGTTIGLRQEISAMFTNPASMQGLQGMQISLGGRYNALNQSQEQQYGPAKYYPNFSLLMEGLTGFVPDPEFDTLTTHTARDSVQRPFDTIAPNWSRKASAGIPQQIILAVPFTLGGLPWVVGGGVVEYADLDRYFQNNNVLSPEVNVQRPVPVPLVKNDSLSLPVQWYQYSQGREGSIRGYGGALAVSLSPEVSLGLSGLLLKGSSDDTETIQGRGKLVFYGSYFRLDPVAYRTVTTTISKYSGAEFCLSGVVAGKFLTAGVSVKPPSTVTRTIERSVQADTGSSTTHWTEQGEDRITLPWRGMAGLSLSIRENLRIVLEYELRPFDSAIYTAASGTESRPWFSSGLLRFGVEYRPWHWLTLRAGMADQAEVYQPEGNPLVGDPVEYSVYSAGAGLTFGGLRIDLAYLFADASYTDMFQNNVNLNTDRRQTAALNISYLLPWTIQE